MSRQGQRENPEHRLGSPWENGYCESFNDKLQDECLKQEIFYSLKEAQVVDIWQSGATAIEYGLIAGMVACAHITVLR